MKLKSNYFKFSLGIFVFVILALIIYFGFYFKNEAVVNNDVKKEVENTIVSDIDGNLYHTVQIGDQTWLQENLKTTHYRNGDPIANVTNLTDWWNLNTGAYCWYNNDTKIGEVYR